MAVILIDPSDPNRRCDESCYNAKFQKCNCICGGVNHGKGEAHAMEHAEELSAKLEEAAARGVTLVELDAEEDETDAEDA